MTKESAKNVDDLTIRDLRKAPVWKYVNDDIGSGELAVAPVKKMPVADLSGCLVGTQVRLANGAHVWAMIGNLDTRDQRRNKHFLFLRVFRGSASFPLARYHDVDAEENGPAALAAFLGRPIDDVFPIEYDLRAVGVGDTRALVGRIEREPSERLTDAEIIRLAVK